MCVAACNADVIAVSLDPPLLSGVPGTSLTFSGTLLNSTGATLFLNSVELNLSGGFLPTDEDTTPFFVNAPLFLGGNASTLSIDLFTISIPNYVVQGPYSGTFDLLGGADENAQDTIGEENFTVQVANVPEPDFALPVLVALSAILIAFRPSAA